MYALTADDYRIRGLESYAYIKKGNKQLPFLIKDFDEDDYNVIATGVLYDGSHTHDVTVEVDDVTFNWPTIGAFNTKISTLSMYRLPVKQWRWCINNENSNIIDPFRDEKHEIDIFHSTFPLKFSTLYNAFNNSYYKPQKAIGLVMSNKRLAAAFHKDWVVGWKLRGNLPWLLYKDVPVAMLNKDGACSLMDDVIWLKEEIGSFGIEVIHEAQ